MSPPKPITLPLHHRLVVFFLSCLAVCLSPGLILCARTSRGRIIGWAGFSFLFLLVLPFTLPLFRTAEVYCGMILLSVFQFLLLGYIAMNQTPRYQPGLLDDLLVSDTPASSRHFFSKIFWAEEDWLWFGVVLGTQLDWRVGRTRGAEIRTRVKSVLDHMRHIGVYKNCRTPWIHLFDGEYRHASAHIALLPEGAPRGALVFLHGHGGNTLFQAFLWREFAQRYQMVVLCPSFSYGPWELPQSESVLEQALETLRLDFHLLPQHTFLTGLSQGGAGVAVAGAGNQFAGLVFLSPTMIPNDLSASGFVQAWQGREVLVIYGEQDRHVTKKSVDEGIATLTANGISVQASFHAHADHSLFLLDTEEVLSKVGAYCERHLPDGQMTEPPSPHSAR